MATGEEINQQFMYGEMARCTLYSPHYAQRLVRLILEATYGPLHQYLHLKPLVSLFNFLKHCDPNSKDYLDKVEEIALDMKPKQYGSPREIFLIQLREYKEKKCR